MKKIVVLTGPSGSGISSARYVFEELAYYVVEGFPVESTESILNALNNGKYGTDNFCLITTVQSAKQIVEIAKQNKEFETVLIVLSTDKAELAKRYALTRHAHPLGMLNNISLEDAIDQDVRDTQDLIPEADITIDSSKILVKELRREIRRQLESPTINQKLMVTFTSFGLKNGAPMALDMLFDVRNIPNPYWVDELKNLTGRDKPVIDYMLSFPQTQKLLDELVSFLEYHLQEVKNSERVSYNIGIACSGGQHRSTFVADYLAKHFKGKYKAVAIHRDSPFLNEKK